MCHTSSFIVKTCFLCDQNKQQLFPLKRNRSLVHNRVKLVFTKSIVMYCVCGKINNRREGVRNQVQGAAMFVESLNSEE